MIISVPLNKLELSDQNVRKTNRGEDIASLADDIASRGLKQNLVVTENGKKGHYKVDAGGRRFLALQLLAEQKRIPKAEPIPCMVELADQALETSLAENLHRVAMNPADEFEAFAAIIQRYAEDGLTDRVEQIANCARRFGVTYRIVEQRLRLAALAPEILEALRTGKISLEAAKAYATYSDQDLQLKIFKAEEKRGQWAHSPQSIRGQMESKVYRLSDPRVIYVGTDDYVAAGGRIERELFMSAEDEDVLLDPHIVDKLVAERAAADAAKVAQDAGFFDGVYKPDFKGWRMPDAPAGFRSAYRQPSQMEPTDREGAVALCQLNAEGKIEIFPHAVFVNEEPDVAPQRPYEPETAEQREARHRLRVIQQKAARLAAPRVAGSALEGRAFWPEPDGYVQAFAQETDGTVVVALLVRIPAAEVEAAMAEAERLYDEQQAAEAAAAEQPEGDANEGGAADEDEVAPAPELVA